MDFDRLNLSSLPLAIYFQLLLIFESVAIGVKLLDSCGSMFVVNATRPVEISATGQCSPSLDRFLLLLQLYLSFLDLVNEHRDFDPAWI